MKSSAMTKAYIGVMVGLVCSVGCVPSQATGPLFTPSDTVDSKRSVVYVYFPHTTASNALYQGLVINGELKSRLDYGGYYVFVSPAGRATFAQKYDEDNKLEVNLVGGRTYFVKLVGNSSTRATKYWFVEVSDQEALPEIRKCRLMEPLKEGDACTGWKRTLPVCQFNPVQTTN